MSYDVEVEARPLSIRGKALFVFNLSIILAMILLAVRYYLVLPERVPIHYDISGNPTSYGDKAVLVCTSLAVIIAPIVIIAAVTFRFKLINKYPYLINLPAFMIRLKELPKSRRGDVVNMVFEAMLVAGLIVGIDMLAIEYVILESAVNPGVSQLITHIALLSILVSIAIIGVVIYVYKRIDERLKAEIERVKRMQEAIGGRGL